VIPLTLDQVAEAVGGQLAPGTDGARLVSGGVTADSRDVEPGGLFLAITGERVDGHDFAAGAMAAGAAGALLSRAVDGPEGPVPGVLVDDPLAALARLASAVLARLPNLTVVALTGSSGKTSTKDLIAELLTKLGAADGETIATVGNFNNELGLPLTVLRANERTAYLVLEMGARGIGHLRYLCEIAPPRVAAVLNVGSAHVGEFGGQDQIAQAKGEIVEALPANGVAVLNADDPRVDAMDVRTRAAVVRFGLDGRADVRAHGVHLDERGRARFELRVGSDRAPVDLRLHGEHQVFNALAAAAVARAAIVGRGGTVTVGALAEALSAAEAATRWRMEVHDRADGVTVINDAYNANPESTKAALRALASIAGAAKPPRRGWAVLGEMLELGDTSAEQHEEIGRFAAELGVNRVVVVGEGAEPIHTGAVRRGSSGAESVMVANPDAALALLREQVRAGDVVLVKASRDIGLRRVGDELLADDPAGAPTPVEGVGA
jgi:UDP-N-acetylmuramoyl-tripeptide--D-alanyl-D-alanine ligase